MSLSPHLRQNSKIINITLVSIWLYIAKHGVQCRWMMLADGMGKHVAADFVVGDEGEPAFWEELEALDEDCGAFWEGGVDFVGYGEEAGDVTDGHGAPEHH
jgi:hypothetical protein